MKTSLSREQIFVMFYVLTEEVLKKVNALKSEEQPVGFKWFTMALNSTITSLEPEVKLILQAKQTAVQEYVEYLQKREELLKRDCKKDEKGNPIVINGEYTYDNDEIKNKISMDMAILIEQYKPAIEKRNQEVQVYKEIMRETIEVDIFKCSYKYFPDCLNLAQFEVLKPMIKESITELEALA